ncbi:MAG TPA: ABC transporter permease [Gaiellaceae bacterium]|nr:ABC transporter permease [Gaiellaceae bacterium]
MRLTRSPSGLFGLLVVFGLLVLVAFPAQIAPYDPAQQSIVDRLQGPSWQHLLGTDGIGRDLLSRLIFGVRVELQVAVPATLGALAFGLLLGLAAGYLGGWVDNALIVVMDAIQAFPAVILALAILALLGPSLRNVTIVLVVAFSPAYARVTRALVLAVKQNTYIEAERSLGAGSPRIVVAHIVPNILPPLLALVAMNLPSAIGAEAGLSFLGLGVQPPTPSWGVILSEGFEYVRVAPWAVLWAGLTLMVTTLGFTYLGEALRDVLDPRLAGVID